MWMIDPLVSPLVYVDRVIAQIVVRCCSLLVLLVDVDDVGVE